MELLMRGESNHPTRVAFGTIDRNHFIADVGEAIKQIKGIA